MTTPTPSPDVRRNNLDEIKTVWLQVCGSCDYGIGYSCTCSSGDYRPVMMNLVDEVEALRAQLSAVTPVIRQQVAEEIAEAKRHLFSRIIASAHLLDVPFSNAPEQSPWTLIKRDMNALTAAIARTHAHPEEGK